MPDTEDISPLAESLAEGVIPCCLKVVCASVTGQQHVFEGRGCEDAWATTLATLADGSSVVAVCVCDGAGSAAYGAEGATLTSRLVTDFLANHFEEMLEAKTGVRQIVETVQDAIQSLAVLRESNIREFACTVVAVACSTDSRWFAVHLGDGGIVMQAGNCLSAVSLPMKGDFSNITYFVTDADAAKCIRYVAGQPVDPTPDAFVLFSDGVENLLINRKTGEVAQAISRMASWLTKYSEAEVTAGLTSELTNFFRTQTGDDCSVAILNRVPMPPSNGDQDLSIEELEDIAEAETVSTGEPVNDVSVAGLEDRLETQSTVSENSPAVAVNYEKQKQFNLVQVGGRILVQAIGVIFWPFLRVFRILRLRFRRDRKASFEKQSRLAVLKESCEPIKSSRP